LQGRHTDHGRWTSTSVNPTRDSSAPEIYRVILKDDGDEVEIGSISVKHSAGATYYWSWAIDTVIPMRSMETSGRGTDRADCMRKFKSAWKRFAADEANLTMFLGEKRRARRDGTR
jgi:hypothetical protein